MTALVGAHISTAGGVPLSPARAEDIGATAMQIFTKNANQWIEPDIGPDIVRAWRIALARSQVRHVSAHDSYLINLASPDKKLRAKSIASFRAELKRCHVLGLDALVSHPGNFMDDRANGIARNADGIAEALDREAGTSRVLLELTAGQGTVLGSTFEELAALLARLDPRLSTRVGICFDTCHAYAAGYDLVKDYDGVWARFDAVLGFASLGALHLNDSATPFGSRKDRHALIGVGSLGKAPFERIMTDARFAAVPKVIETPKGADMLTNDRKMMRLLREFAGEVVPPFPRRPRAPQKPPAPKARARAKATPKARPHR